MKFLVMLMLIAPAISNAALTRTINGVEYNLHDDFDTADGECVIRGAEMASQFVSLEGASKPVLKLNADGSVKSVMEANSNVWIIHSLDCM